MMTEAPTIGWSEDGYFPSEPVVPHQVPFGFHGMFTRH
jgi:hypothetical protein